MSFILKFFKWLLCCGGYDEYQHSNRGYGDCGTSVRSPFPSYNHKKIREEESRIRIGDERQDYGISTPINSSLHEPVIYSASPVFEPPPNVKYFSTPPPKESAQNNNSLYSEIERKSSNVSLVPVKQEAVKPLLKKLHDDPQIPKSSALSPLPASVVNKNSVNSKPESKALSEVQVDQEIIKKSLENPHKVPCVDKFSASISPPLSIHNSNSTGLGVNKLIDHLQCHIPSGKQSYKAPVSKDLEVPKTPSSVPSSGPSIQLKKTEYVWVLKDATPSNVIPVNVKHMIKSENLPEVLENHSLSLDKSKSTDQRIDQRQHHTLYQGQTHKKLAKELEAPKIPCSNPLILPKKTKCVWVQKNTTSSPQHGKHLVKSYNLTEAVNKSVPPSVHKSSSAEHSIDKLIDEMQYHSQSRRQFCDKLDAEESVVPEKNLIVEVPSPSPSGCNTKKRRRKRKKNLFSEMTPVLLRDLTVAVPAATSSSDSDLPTPTKSTKYVLFQNDKTPIYVIPEEIKHLIKNDIVPEVLKKPLSVSTYREYFAALLYAEDFYTEKWNGYSLSDVLLELHDAAMYKKSNRNKILTEIDFNTKFFVAFEIDSIPENRPFLLSRDFVLLCPSGEQIEPFEGFLYRVVKRNIVVADFGDDFHSQHVPSRKYDVSFSFNRVCLKRCHQAILAATDPLFLGFLFPEQKFGTTYLHPNSLHLSLNRAKELALQRILSLRGPPPYLIKGPLFVTFSFIQEAILQIYRTSPDCRILITSPTNAKCDILMKSLEIPDSEILRVNAAFREYDEVPDDILPACRYEEEEGCFTCPSLEELRNSKVTSSTFMSCFRLYNGGICAGHYSHIFLVDASSATEPEAMVALANLADQSTAVIVTGASWDSSHWVRSDISRKYGLKVSYFERLVQNEPYLSSDPRFVFDLEVERESEDDYYHDFYTDLD